MENLTKSKDVPCNGCTLCCQSETLVLHPEKGDVIENYLTRKIRHPLTGQPAIALKVKPNGDCIYLGESGCTIYENRPTICREFDCRKMFARFMDWGGRQARKRAVKAGLVGKDVLDAGHARLHTLEGFGNGKAK